MCGLIPFNPSSQSGHLVYRNNSGKALSTTESIKDDSLRGSSMLIPQTVSNSNGTHWIEAGSIKTNLYANSNQPDISGFVSYGKNNFKIGSPSVSFSKSSPSIGITFGNRISTVGTARITPKNN